MSEAVRGARSNIEVSKLDQKTRGSTKGDHYSKEKLSPLSDPPCLAGGFVDRVLLFQEFRDPCRFTENILRKIREFRQL